MNCKNCGNELLENAVFCSECGAKVIAESPVLEIEKEALENETPVIESGTEELPAEEAAPEEIIPSEDAEAPAEEPAEGQTEALSEEPSADREPSCESAAVIEEALAAEEKAPAKKNTKLRRAGKIAVLTAGFLAASIVIVFVNLWLFPKVIIPNVKYFAANQYYHGGNYKEAAVLYSSMPGFKNSRRQCSKAVYALAEESMELEKYQTAIACYSWLGGYEDSAERLDEARNAYGTELLDGGKYYLAMCQFEYIDFKDSECLENYIKAQKLYESSK